MKINFKKRGLSAVISTLLFVLLAFVTAAIVWGVVSNIVDENTKKSEACFDSFGKVEINSFYTCYNSETNELKIGIERKNFELDALSVSVSGGGNSYVFEIPADEARAVDLVTNYNHTSQIIAPSKNSGTSYYLNLADAGIIINDDFSINLAPIVKGYQCDASNTIYDVENC